MRAEDANPALTTPCRVPARGPIFRRFSFRLGGRGMPFSLTQRLMCAASHAYGIRPPGPVWDMPHPPHPQIPAPLPASAWVGYAAPPVPVVGGGDPQDAA